MKNWCAKNLADKVALLALSVVISGCGKQAAPEPSVPPSPPPVKTVHPPTGAGKMSGAPVAQPAPAAPQNLAASASAEAAADQMTLELRKYVAYSRTIPKSFEDFVVRHPMKFPAPPAGKKYAIEDGRVIIR